MENIICEVFLYAALALPLHTKNQYTFLKNFIEIQHPDKTVVFVNENELLLNPGAEFTGMGVLEKPRKKEALAIWIINKAA